MYRLYFRNNVPENVTLTLKTKNTELTTNVSKIVVDNSVEKKVWPIELIGHNAGHSVLKVNAEPNSSIE